MGTSLKTRLGLGGTVASVLVTALAAQENDGPPTTRNFAITLDQNFRATDNLALDPESEGTTYQATTRLGFDTVIEDELNQLNFNASTGYRLLRGPGGEDEDIEEGVTSPRLRFSYSRSGVENTLNLNASYRRDEIRFLEPLEDFVDDDGEIVVPDDAFDLEEQAGTRTAYTLGVSGELRRNAPLSLSYQLSTSRRTYSDVTDPDLTDTSTDSASTTARLRLDPVSQLRLTLGYSRFREDGGDETERDRGRVSLGYSRSLSQVLDVSASLGYTRIETDEAGGSETDEGLTGSLNFTLDRPQGAIVAGVDVDTDVNGRRISASVGRNLELPTSSLSATLGVTRVEQDGDDDEDSSEGFETIASLSYSRDLPTGGLSLSLDRTVSSVDEDEDQPIVTTVSGNYTYTINDLSSLSFNAAHTVRDDEFRSNLGATYSRALTEDWSLNAGYRYIREKDDGEDTADSNAVFVNIGRRFDLPF